MPARGPISAEAFGGYASANLRVGFGVRGGYTLDNGLYLGGAFTYHLGTRFGSTTDTFFYPAFELGYDYRALPEVTLRAYAGIGLGIQHASDSSNILAQSTTDASFTFYPGVQFDYQLPRSPVYFGVDMRVLVAAGENAPSASFGFFFPRRRPLLATPPTDDERRDPRSSPSSPRPMPPARDRRRVEASACRRAPRARS